jgi:hypothetical protein
VFSGLGMHDEEESGNMTVLDEFFVVLGQPRFNAGRLPVFLLYFIKNFLH